MRTDTQPVVVVLLGAWLGLVIGLLLVLEGVA